MALFFNNSDCRPALGSYYLNLGTGFRLNKSSSSTCFREKFGGGRIHPDRLSWRMGPPISPISALKASGSSGVEVHPRRPSGPLTGFGFIARRVQHFLVAHEQDRCARQRSVVVLNVTANSENPDAVGSQLL